MVIKSYIFYAHSITYFVFVSGVLLYICDRRCHKGRHVPLVWELIRARLFRERRAHGKGKGALALHPSIDSREGHLSSGGRSWGLWRVAMLAVLFFAKCFLVEFCKNGIDDVDIVDFFLKTVFDKHVTFAAMRKRITRLANKCLGLSKGKA